MSDHVLIAKGEIIERRALRARAASETSVDFTHDFNAQNIAFVNVTRACEACVGIAMRLIKINKFGLPNSCSDSFLMLASNKMISPHLAEKLTKMIGFRSVAGHAYTNMDYDIVASVIRYGLDDALEFVGITMATVTLRA